MNKHKVLKNHIVRHFPCFVEHRELPEKGYFNTVEDLLNIPWVKSFSDDSEFYKYGISDELLMATYKEGRNYWVVGSIEHPELVKLPKILKYTKEKAIFEVKKQGEYISEVYSWQLVPPKEARKTKEKYKKLREKGKITYSFDDYNMFLNLFEEEGNTFDLVYIKNKNFASSRLINLYRIFMDNMCFEGKKMRTVNESKIKKDILKNPKLGKVFIRMIYEDLDKLSNSIENIKNDLSTESNHYVPDVMDAIYQWRKLLV